MKLKRTLITSMLVASTLSATACAGLAGGVGNKVDNTVENTKTLQVMVINKGYGVNWLYEIASAFEQEYAADGVEVKITQVADAAATSTSIESGPKLNDIDLYFDVNALTSYER